MRPSRARHRRLLPPPRSLRAGTRISASARIGLGNIGRPMVRRLLGGGVPSASRAAVPPPGNSWPRRARRGARGAGRRFCRRRSWCREFDSGSSAPAAARTFAATAAEHGSLQKGDSGTAPPTSRRAIDTSMQRTCGRIDTQDRAGALRLLEHAAAKHELTEIKLRRRGLDVTTQSMEHGRGYEHGR
jgi:hypothetical protein